MEEEAEVEKEVRGSLSIRNPFSFVIRSRQTLRDQPAAERRISLKRRCYKTVDQDGATAAENRLVVQEMATPLRRDPKNRVPTSRISSRHPDGPGQRRILRSSNTKRDSLGRPDVDHDQEPENQRSLYRGKSSPKLDGNFSEPKLVL